LMGTAASHDSSMPDADAVPPFDPPRAREQTLSVHKNAVALFVTIVVSAAFGYLTWLAAAHLASPDTVGLAAAVVSAAVLCGNVSILGLGITTITFLPRQLRDPSALLDGFFTIVVLGACLCGLNFVLFSALFLEDLHILAANPAVGASFVMLATATSATILLDGTAIALRRADFALTRSLVAGIGKLVVLGCAALATTVSAGTLVATWALATVAGCLLGYRQVRSRFPRYRYRPRISRDWGRIAVRNGLSNHVLNLSRLAPTLAIPLIVTERLSPSENAYWYAAWMIAFLIRFIPGATAEATFAEITNRSATLGRGLWKSLSSSVAVSMMAMIGLIVAAPVILGMMGDEYAAGGTAPLRILALSIVPQIFIEFYILTRRVSGRLFEPNVVFAVTAILALAAASYGAASYGLVGVATGWLLAESAAGCWAAIRFVNAMRADHGEGLERERTT
jgi:O-antigen/teichoic acid export membrane protein